MIDVVEPATAEVMASIPRAGVEETDAAVERARAPSPPGATSRRPIARSCCTGLANALEAARGGAGGAGGAQRGQADRRRARRDGDGGGHLPLLRRRARAADRQDDPGGGRRRHDVPRAARRRRADHALELPAHDRVLEGRAGARGRQHGRAQAGRADAADLARAGADRARGGPARGRAERRRRAGPDLRAAARRAPATWPRSPSPARPRSAAASPPAPRETIKRVTLELGGKSANVVFADADLEAAAAAAPGAVFGNAGQDCCARSRILVERAVLDRFLEAMEDAVESIVVGDPLDESTQMGPLISADQLETVSSYVQDGSPVAIRGQRAGGPGLLVRAHGALPGRQRRRAPRARRSSARSSS